MLLCGGPGAGRVEEGRVDVEGRRSHLGVVIRAVTGSSVEAGAGKAQGKSYTNREVARLELNPQEREATT